MIKMSTGKYVESYMLDMIEELFPSLYRASTREEDLYYGTDLFIGDTPIDITLDADKNNVKFIKKIILEGLTVNVLIRYGNGFESFDKPVLVFHLETYDLRDRMLICELVEETFTREIVSSMLGLYR